MLTSLALIFLVGMFLGSVFSKFKIPSLLGMLLTGIVLGPYALNVIDESILNISADLRQLALLIILMRAGLSLDIDKLLKIGRPAVLMCFVPACFEIAATTFIAPKIFGITVLEAAIMGCVVAAVSPAVIVPRMIKLMEEGYGTDKNIPHLIMAGASVDDVFVIILFTSFTSLATGGSISSFSFAEAPISIVLGILVGGVIGSLMSIAFKKIHIRDSAKVLIMLSMASLLLALEKILGNIIPFSGLLSVMAVGIATRRVHPILASRLSIKFSKLWVAAEILLFVLVGATVDIRFAAAAGGKTILLLIVVLLFRMAGVFFSLLRTKLNYKERLFCMIAYMPKATVQAAIGGIPLAMGLNCGDIILTVAVVSILITAPLGALGVDLTYKKLLSHEARSYD